MLPARSFDHHYTSDFQSEVEKVYFISQLSIEDLDFVKTKTKETALS